MSEEKDPREMLRMVSPIFAQAYKDVQDEYFGGALEQKASGLASYDGDPVRFSVEVLGHNQWEFQKYVQRSLMEHRFVIVSGPRKNSKTHVAAETILAFCATAPTVCLSTSATHRQVEYGIWQKVRAFHADALTKLPGSPRAYKWEIAPEWYAVGFSTDQPGNVQGFHAGIELEQDAEQKPEEAETGIPLQDALKRLWLFKQKAHRRRRRHRLLLVLDEVFEIPAPILERLAGSMSGANVYVLAFGNPTLDPESDHPAVRWMKPGSGWHRIHVAGAELPDSSWEPEPPDKCFHFVPEAIQSEEWRRNEIKQHGIDSPYVRCFVYGLPARADLENPLIPRRLLEQCARLELPWDGSVDCMHMGVDIGAGGPDPCVAYLWRGGTLCARHEWRTVSLMDSAGVIVELMRAWGVGEAEVPAHNVHIDSIGVGRGVVDRLRQMGFHVDGVDFGAKMRKGMHGDVTGQMAFPNIRTQAHWCFRRLLEESRICVPEAYGPVWRQAGWYSYDTKGSSAATQILLREDKEEIRKRFGRSPDDLDAAIYGLCRLGQPKITFLGDRPNRKTLRDPRVRLALGGR